MAGELSIKVNEWKKGQMVSTLKKEFNMPQDIMENILKQCLADFYEKFPDAQVITATMAVPEVKAVVTYVVKPMSEYPKGSKK